jgi:hypothetical protein
MRDFAELTRQYLADFSSKSVAGLERRFAENVTLRDWELGTVRGKAAVLAANGKIFDSVRTIEARPVAIYTQGRTAVAELEVHVDGKLALLVTDVIDFDEGGLITAVRAYRGN